MWIWCHFLQRTHGGSCSLSSQEHTAQLGGGVCKFPSWEHEASCKNPWEHEMLRVEMRGEGLRARATDRAYLQSLHPGPIPGEIPTLCVSAFRACLSSPAHPEGVWRAEERGSCPWVSSDTCRLCRGRGWSHVAATAPNVQGTLVSPGTSVSAITHSGWCFCLHDPKQWVWVRSSHKDWWSRAIRGQKKLTSFKQRMWYSLRWLKPHCELIAKHF